MSDKNKDLNIEGQEPIEEFALVESEAVEPAEGAPELEVAEAPEPVAPEPVAPEPVATEIVAPEPVVPEISIEDFESKRSELQNQIIQLEKNRDLLVQEIEDHVAIREDLNQWINARKESFAWKLINSLKTFRENLTRDEETLKNFSMNSQLLDHEFGAKTRRWVMKSLGIPLLVAVVLIWILEILRRSAQLVNVPNPSNPATTVRVNAVDNFLLNNLGLSHGSVIFIIAIIMTFLLIGVLFAYMRRTSEYRFIVSREVKLTKVMEEAAYYLKQEREKIDSLHPQVPQILELLSLGLHQPWQIDSKYSQFEGELPDASKIPESLDISVPTEKSAKQVFPNLVLRAVNQVQQIGWRAEAFEKLIQRLSERVGFGEENTALRQLDQDQRRNGKRQLLLDAANKEDLLIEIGDELVKEYALTIQAKVLPHLQPEVMSLRPNPLESLQLTDNLVGSQDTDSSPWDAKLAEIAGASSPWAPGTFSARGQVAARHEHKPESVFISTDRAAQLAHKEVTTFKEVQSDTRPFDVSIRVDLSEWCHPEEVAIFQDYQPSEAEIAVRAENEIKQAVVTEISHPEFNDENLAF